MKKSLESKARARRGGKRAKGTPQNPAGLGAKRPRPSTELSLSPEASDSDEVEVVNVAGPGMKRNQRK